MPSPLDHLIEVLPDGAGMKPGTTLVSIDEATGKVASGGFLSRMFAARQTYAVGHDRAVTLNFPVDLMERRSNTSTRISARVILSLPAEPDAAQRKAAAERVAEAFDQTARSGGLRIPLEEAVRLVVWRRLAAELGESSDAPSLARLVHRVVDPEHRLETEIKSTLERAFGVRCDVVLQPPETIPMGAFEVRTARFTVVTRDLPDREFSTLVSVRVGPADADRLRIAPPTDMSGWRELVVRAVQAAYRTEITAFDHVFDREERVRRVVASQLNAELGAMGRSTSEVVIEHEDPSFPRRVTVAKDVHVEDRRREKLHFRIEVNMEHSREGVRRFLIRGKPDVAALIERTAREAITRAMQGRDFTVLGDPRSSIQVTKPVELAVTEVLHEAGLDSGTVVISRSHPSMRWLSDVAIEIPTAEYRLPSSNYPAELSFDIRVRFQSIDRLADFLVPQDRLEEEIIAICKREIEIVFRGTALERYLGYFDEYRAASGERFARANAKKVMVEIKEAIQRQITARIGDLESLVVQATPVDKKISAAIDRVTRMSSAEIVTIAPVRDGERGLRNVTIRSAWRLQPPAEGETFAAYLTRRAETFDEKAFKTDMERWVATHIAHLGFADVMNIHIGAPGSGGTRRIGERQEVGLTLQNAMTQECAEKYGLGVVNDWIQRDLTLDETIEADRADAARLSERGALDRFMIDQREAMEDYRRRREHLREEASQLDQQMKRLLQNPHQIGSADHARLKGERAKVEKELRDLSGDARFLPEPQGFPPLPPSGAPGVGAIGGAGAAGPSEDPPAPDTAKRPRP